MAGGPELVEDVAVKLCERRGVAIDLVLDRGRENQSQFVFTRLKGMREASFWQTSRTAAKSCPGVRVPGRRPSFLKDMTIRVDTRERYSTLFKNQYLPGGVLSDLLARIQVRYPNVPIVFCETRPLSEEWTFRFLGAALATLIDQPDDPTEAKKWID